MISDGRTDRHVVVVTTKELEVAGEVAEEEEEEEEQGRKTGDRTESLQQEQDCAISL